MALTLSPSYTEVITPDEALAYADVGSDRCTLDQLIEKAWVLKGLANNQVFLRDLINQDIVCALNGEKTSIYTPQSIALGSGRSITFRANFWFVPTRNESRREFEMSLYSYEFSHDHNFNFLTIGYHGPGYTTDIYEYDRSQVSGYVGERVELRYLERTVLSVGKMLAFRSGRDVHTQYIPDQFSISINMMAHDDEELVHPQFSFDLRTKTILKSLDNQVSGRVSLIKFAKLLGDDSTLHLLKDLTTERFAPTIRAAAYDALLARTSGEEAHKIQYEIQNNSDAEMERRVAIIGHL